MCCVGARVAGPAFVTEPQDADVKLGRTVSLQCHASGSPTPVITWYFNGRARAEGGDANRLRIFEFGSKDAGVYYCNASNEAGSVVSRRAIVQYHGKWSVVLKKKKIVLTVTRRWSVFISTNGCMLPWLL